jgi:hypothetical protein
MEGNSTHISATLLCLTEKTVFHFVSESRTVVGYRQNKEIDSEKFLYLRRLGPFKQEIREKDA